MPGQEQRTAPCTTETGVSEHQREDLKWMRECGGSDAIRQHFPECVERKELPVGVSATRFSDPQPSVGDVG